MKNLYKRKIWTKAHHARGKMILKHKKELMPKGSLYKTPIQTVKDTQTNGVSKKSNFMETQNIFHIKGL